ncbi:helix-turn-helix domain-containing protein [Verticiella sediminum]|uniref:Helix-turn-helix domain-containing protein n=1 Tax=Verticiella sediminum TaxID=1247510 RepID=A0A556A7S6_9BURK|nr:helix-turn-helix domain-containing protein [Verticiella sediminum]TSH88925.1 helix-turn-helix domain-containing protein [Verticiella sediminum]
MTKTRTAALPDADTSAYFVRALAKGLDILHCFGPGETYLGNKDISERVGLPKQTVSRLTMTLADLGYLAYSASLGKYRLAAGLLALAYPLLTSMRLRRVARPFLQDLADELGASVSVGQHFRGQMMFVESHTARGKANLAAEIGSVMPMHTTAMGKAYLASLPIPARFDLVASLGLDAEAGKRLSAELQACAADIATLGFCTAEMPRPQSRIAAAVPLCQPIDGEQYVINCGFPSYATTQEHVRAEVGPRLVGLVREVEAAAGLR